MQQLIEARKEQLLEFQKLETHGELVDTLNDISDTSIMNPGLKTDSTLRDSNPVTTNNQEHHNPENSIQDEEVTGRFSHIGV